MKTTSDRQRNWFAPSRHGAAMLVIALCALVFFANFATAAIYTWDDGDAGDSNWSTGANWVDDGAPPSGAGHVITFGDSDADYGTNTMDAGWSGLGLVYANTSGAYTTDLSTNTLTLSGTGSYLRSGYNVSGSSATIQNGIVSLGTSGTPGSVTVGYRSSAGTGALTLSSGTLDAYLSGLTVGYTASGNVYTVVGTLDLSTASVTTGGAANKLQVGGDIIIGGGSGGVGTLKLPTSVTEISSTGTIEFGNYRSTATVDLTGSGSALDTITATNFAFGNGSFGYDSGGGVYVLPSGVTLNVGSDGNAGYLRVGYRAFDASASLALSSGSLNAYLNELTVGTTSGGNTRTVNGTLDLSTASVTTGGAANKLQVAGDITIGGGNNSGVGTLKLPTSVTEISSTGAIVLGGFNGTATVDLTNSGTALDTITATSFAFGKGSFGYDSGGGVYVLPSGVTLNVGSDGNAGYLRVGYSQISGSAVMFLSSGTLNAYLNELTVGTTYGGNTRTVNGTLDLSTASVTTGGEANKLQVGGNITVGGGNNSGIGTLKLPTSVTEISATGTIDFGGTAGNATVDLGGAGTQLDSITAKSFSFGNGNFGYDSGSGVYVLPSGLDMAIGSEGDRGIMRVGYRTGTGSATLALPDGTLTAYLTELTVGYSGTGNPRAIAGTLDLSTASAVTIDNTGATSIGNNGGSGPSGTIRLPSGSTVTTATLSMGVTASHTGKLYLVDADFAVTGATAGALTLGDGTDAAGTDLIDIQILGTSSGLDIQGTASTVLSVGTSGLINITFMQDPLDVTLGTALDHTDIFYGLKWAGDHVTDLTGLGTRLAWDDTTNLTGDFNNAASIFYDTATNATYVGFYINQVVIPEPASLALLGLGAAWLLNRRRVRSTTGIPACRPAA